MNVDAPEQHVLLHMHFDTTLACKYNRQQDTIKRFTASHVASPYS
jgi:hypothetical protein